MKKKLLSLLLTLVLVLSLFAGCGSDAASSAPAEEAPQSAAAESAAAPEEAPAPDVEEAPSAAEASVVEETPAEPVYEKVEVPLPIGDGEEVSMFLLVPPFVSPMLGEAGNLSVLKELSARTGLTLAITEGSYLDGQNAINLMMAAGDYCDIINHADLYAAGIDAAVNEEIIIDLSGYILNDMPNLLASIKAYDADVVKQITTSSGYMPYFPQLYDAPIVDNFATGVRKDLMDEQGLETPKTYDEFHDVLSVIKSEYDLQYGLDPGGFDQSLLTGMNLKPGNAGLEGLIVMDGQVQFAGEQDAMYDYFEMIAQWYSEGLIFSDFISYETFDQTNMISGGTLFGNGNANAQTISEADAAGNGAVVEALPYLTETGAEEIKVFGGGEIVRSQAWSISSQADDDTIDLIVQMVDYLFSDEGTLLFNYGVEGEAHELDENGEPVWSDLIMNYEGGTTTAAFLYATATPSEYICGVYEMGKFNYSYTDAMYAAEDIINHSSTGEYDFPIGAENTISSEDSITAAGLASDINTYISETILSWIYGEAELNEDTWQAYIDNCYDMGLQDILDIYQAAYDTWMA